MHVWCGDCAEDSLPSFLSTLVSPPLFPHVEGLVGQLLAHEWASGKTVTVGDYVVHRFGAKHPGEAAIIRVDDAAGPVMAYAPDNELAYANESPEHVAWIASLCDFLRDVPLLIHDATYTDDELAAHVGWGHSSGTEAVRLAIACGAGTLALFHHHPDRDDDAIERIVEAARRQGVEAHSTVRVLAAWEGLTLSV
jgi:phosphoribosyl 1,2-cyclic phosphodiesterase